MLALPGKAYLAIAPAISQQVSLHLHRVCGDVARSIEDNGGGYDDPERVDDHKVEPEVEDLRAGVDKACRRGNYIRKS